MANNIDHSVPDLTIYQRVLNRLPFLVNDPQNESLISAWTYEVMWQLEPCFRIAKQVEPADESIIGKEQYYKPPFQAIIADVVAIYILMSLATARAGNGTPHPSDAATVQNQLSVTGGALFVKSAKAGSASTEFAQVSIDKVSFFAMNAGDLLKTIKEKAKNLAQTYGCPIDICDDCSIKFNPIKTGKVRPFIVTGGGFCCGS
jgi:hypothetical protein